MNDKNYLGILTTVSLGIDGTNGSAIQVQINQELIKNDDESYTASGIFCLYQNNIEPITYNIEELMADDRSDLPDKDNPDYLGRILFDNDGHWIYDGESLAIAEQEQIAEFLLTFEEGDVDY